MNDNRSKGSGKPAYDAVVVGAGPNGLAAAITLAEAGRSVLVLEAESTIGGAVRSLPLTLPGFVHDFGATIFPLAAGSPLFRSLPLHDHGLRWVHPPIQLAHPFDDGAAAAIYRSVRETSAGLGGDAGAYRKLMQPFAGRWEDLSADLLGPLKIPRHPFLAARFGSLAVRPVSWLIRELFAGREASSLLAGMAAHSFLPSSQPLTGAFALMLGITAHAVGWPFVRGGSQGLSDALAGYLRSIGGEIRTGFRVTSIDDLPRARAYLFDVTPRQLLEMAGDRLPSGYRRKLNAYRYGPGAFKLDWALSGPIPWKAPECSQAATVHLGGSWEEIAASEAEVWRGRHPEKPFVLLAQYSQFDPSRAPDGKYTAWAYCHVPNGSNVDVTERVERQIERFAPGFRDLILARHVMSPDKLEFHDANLVGGDINGGMQDYRQFFTRPTPRLVPYTTPARGLYICSSSTPPGGGTHGICGYHAARAALRYSLR